MRISDWSSDVCSSDLHDLDLALLRGIALLDCTIEVIFSARQALEGTLDIVGLGGQGVQASQGRFLRAAGLDDGGVEQAEARGDRKSVVEGKSVSVRVAHGGRRRSKKKKEKRRKRP